MIEPGITIIEGASLHVFMAAMGIEATDTEVYRVRIWPQSDGSIKFKVNERTWTYTLGRADA